MNIASTGGSSMLQQMQQAMFSKLDVNADGQLSSDEFKSIGQNMPEPGSSGSAKSMRGGGFGGANFTSATMSSLLSMQEMQDGRDARATEMFSNADADGDGALTADELVADMTAHAPPGASGASDTSTMAADLISNADSDGDGALSLDEFKAAAPPRGGPPPGGPPPGGSASAASDSASTDSSSTDPMDTNGDGKVSMSELLASLQSVNDTADGFPSEVSDLLAKLLDRLASETAATATTVTEAA